MKCYLVQTGVANVASFSACLRRLGVEPVVTGDPDLVRSAEAVVLPGVGSFDAGMAALTSSGLDRALRSRIEGGRATLAVCLGMQLLASSSQESSVPASPGLGILQVDVKRLSGAPRLPHFGWNGVRPGAGARLLQSGDAYFAHTYCIHDQGPLVQDGWTVATATEGSTFVCAAERGPVVAAQFHPELSGAFGHGLIGRWLVNAGLDLKPQETSPW